jgi:hypothetical protein
MKKYSGFEKVKTSGFDFYLVEWLENVSIATIYHFY